MSIGTPQVILTDDLLIGASNLTSAATSADVPVGSLVAFCVYNFENDTITGVVDEAGNVYSLAAVSPADTVGGTRFTAIYYCFTTNDLPAGSTFTINGSFSFGIYITGVLSVSGVSALDKDATGQSSSSVNSLSLSTGALASASEIVIGTANSAASSFGTWTEGAGFTQAAAGGANGIISYEIVSSSAAVTWAPSWSIAADYSAVLVSFKVVATVSLVARGTAIANARTSAKGAAPFNARVLAQGKGRGSAKVAAAMAARAKASAAGRSAPSGKVPLAARGAGAAKARPAISGIVPLVARAFSAAMARNAPAFAVALRSIGKASAAGTAHAAGVVPLFARGAAAAAARAAIGSAGVVQLFARSMAVAAGLARPAGVVPLAARSQAAATARASGTFRAALSAASTAMARGRAVASGSVALAARGTSAAFGRLLRQAFELVSDPRFIDVARLRRLITRPTPRKLVTMPAPRKRVTSPKVKGQPVPQCPDFSPLDPNEVVTNTFDLAPWLPAGVTVASISSVSCAAYQGADADAADRIVGSPSIGPSPSTGAATSTVLFQVGNSPVAGVVYRLQATIVTSDGQTLNPWAHQACNAVN